MPGAAARSASWTSQRDTSTPAVKVSISQGLTTPGCRVAVWSAPTAVRWNSCRSSRSTQPERGTADTFHGHELEGHSVT